MTDSPTVYVYAIVRSRERPDLDEAPAGVPDASPPRPESAGGELWLVVSDVGGEAWEAPVIERRLEDLAWVSDRALAHERVVEHLAERLPVVPMKLFTLFTSVERAAASLSGRRDELEGVFARVAGCTEWGVQVHLEAERARRQAEEAMASQGPPVSGRDFLLRKKRRRDAVSDVAGPAAERVETLVRDLVAIADDTVRKPVADVPSAPGEAGGARLLLDAAFLVPNEESDRFDSVVRQGAEDLAPHACRVTLTGPWPPYHFVGQEGGP